MTNKKKQQKDFLESCKGNENLEATQEFDHGTAGSEKGYKKRIKLPSKKDVLISTISMMVGAGLGAAATRRVIKRKKNNKNDNKNEAEAEPVADYDIESE